MVISVNRLTSVNLDKYDVIDSALIPSKDFVRNFGESNDYIEAHLYTNDDRLIISDYNITEYGVPADYKPGTVDRVNSIQLSPENFVQDSGFTIGTFIVQYNILRKKITDITGSAFFIKDISTDRTELRLSSNILTDSEIESGVVNFLYEIQTSPYYKDFLLNFGDNKLVNAVNIALDKSGDRYTVIVKLYQPLPSEFAEKSQLWIVEELSESYVFQVELGIDNEPEKIEYLRSANFDINTDSNSIRSSDYTNIQNLFYNNATSSFQRVLNELNNKSISISVDYSDYSDFIHYSSAKERLLNFVYKLRTIEEHSSDINSLRAVPNFSASFSVSSSLYNIQTSINNVIKSFDGYENYLYRVSGSNSWPKSGSYPDYYLYPTTSSLALTWLGSDDSTSNLYGGQLYTASIYDIENQDNLVFALPEFIVNDSNSDQFILFVEMLGQHFDNIWIYIKAVTDLYKNTNSFATGVSKDLVYNALRSLGIKMYNSNSDQNIFEYLIGSTTSGSYNVPTNPYATVVSASAYITSGQDITKEQFKRIYHNLPLLLKSKGSVRGIKSLICSFGVPDTILDVVQYGGSDKFNDTLEYSYDRFSYALSNVSGSFVKTPWSLLRYNPTNNDKFLINPDAIEFRIKPTRNVVSGSVTLFQKNLSSSAAVVPMMGIMMNYTSSNNIPSANVSFILSGSAGNVSSSLVVPMYVTGSDGDSLWWSFMLKRRYANLTNNNTQAQYYDLYVKNNISGRIGNQASSSLYITGSVSSSYNYSWNYLGTTSSMVMSYLGGNTAFTGPYVSSSNFSGSIQEFRYWTENISESAFNMHVLNPQSIEGNTSSSAYEFLSLRYSLGNDLNVYNNSLTQSIHSVHPKYGNRYLRKNPYESQYGYEALDSSSYYFVNNTDAAAYSSSNAVLSFFRYPNVVNYRANEEKYYSNVPNSGYYSSVTEKVRIIDNVVTGSVLSPILKLEQEEDYRTKDIHFLDVSLSPQSQIDKDIVEQYGKTVNIDDLIGNPADAGCDKYPSLVALKEDYYQKFFSEFNYMDFIRLISFFDNSLFKMIKDYVPTRSNLSTGITVKPIILDRSKVARHEPCFEELTYLTEIDTGNIRGCGSFSSSYLDGRDAYNGELSGSRIDTHDYFTSQSCNPYTTFRSDFNQTTFDHSPFNTLLNNVSKSIASRVFMEVDRYNPSILTPAYVQDGYYEYQRHIRPRYVGSKSTSALYNFYTPGDTAYGKSAAIDKNVLKFAFLNQANIENINFWDKATMNIKYLIDASGSALELTRKNYNIFEVQNTFKSGDNVGVSLMDPFNPSNQSELEGIKRIWEGGFSFSPIVFREINENLDFDYIVPTSFTTERLGMKVVMTSSVNWESTYQIYPNTADGAGTGGYPIFKIAGVRQTGEPLSYRADSTVNTNTWIYQTQIPIAASGPFVSSDGAPFYPGGWNEAESPSYWMSIDCFMANSTSSAAGGYCSSEFHSDIVTVDDGNDRYSYYQVPRTSQYTINCNIPLRITAGDNGTPGLSVFKVVAVLEKKVGNAWTYLTHSKLNAISIPSQFAVNADSSSICNDDYGPDSLRIDCAISNYQVSLNQGELIRTKLYIVEQRRFFSKIASVVIEMLQGNSDIGNFEIYDNVTSIRVPITRTYIPSDVTGSSFFSLLSGSYNRLIFNNSASLIYGTTRFNTSSSIIPERYSAITDDFRFMVGDYIRFGSFYQYTNELYYVTEVIDPIIYSSGSNASVSRSLQLVLDRDVNPQTVTSLNFAILRKQPDETSVILSFNKDAGEASSGFLVPYNILPEIDKNIGNITGPLKQSLLSNVMIL